MSLQINKDTKLFGSFSANPGSNGCLFFNNAFQRYGINAIYKSFYSTNIVETIQAVKHLKFGGFALSMPLKTAVIDHLDELDTAATRIGAVNTIVIDDNGRLIGYNTDWIGVKNFIKTNLPFIPKSITILGTGGFSRAIQYTCKNMGIDFRIIGRNEWGCVSELEGCIINATPVPNITTRGTLIDGIPTTMNGKLISLFQAADQFKLYTGIEYEES